VVLNEDVVSMTSVRREVIEEVAGRERVELERRERAYRGDRLAPQLAGKVCILIDDGLATGASMRAAAQALRGERPAKIVVAVPVAARETCEAFRSIVDEVVCAMTPEYFQAVGRWYEDFSQTSDEEVRRLLEEAARPHPART
jgi:predicted phosphoribosyltransferase